MEFSRQEYWSGLSFPLPGDLPNPGIKPRSILSSPLAGKFFTTVPPWETPIQSGPYSSMSGVLLSRSLDTYALAHKGKYVRAEGAGHLQAKERVLRETLILGFWSPEL